MTEGKKHELAELIARTWSLINYIDERLKEETVREAEKIRWARVLAKAIDTLNKLFYKAGVGKLNEDDMAILLSKIPKKFSIIVRRRMQEIGSPRTKSPK
ncbi:MAG: hypothetical protein OEY81_05920 [Candidatus Bathyarchaeota archaeon]|nr:hypothetical protein [Candidatus Bathyarchaeota archaeon]